MKITNYAYTRESLLKKEYTVLSALAFDVTVPTVNRFTERFCQLTQADKRNIYLAMYIGELSMMELTMNRWFPSRIACASIYLSRKMLNKNGAWPLVLEQTTSYSER